MSGSPSYHHLVLFRLKDGTSQVQKQEAVKRLEALGQGHNGLKGWVVVESIDTRKGEVLLQQAEFGSVADFEEFKDSSQHVETARFMSQIADWWIADYEADDHAAS
jgi:hypothetical protein